MFINMDFWILDMCERMSHNIVLITSNEQMITNGNEIEAALHN